MNTIHEQVAALQQKIDYLIEQITILTGEHTIPASSLRAAPRKGRPAVREAGHTDTANEIGINRYRAMRAEEQGLT